MRNSPDSFARWRDHFDQAELKLTAAEKAAFTGQSRVDLINEADQIRREGVNEFNATGGDRLELLRASQELSRRFARLHKPATAAQSILDPGLELNFTAGVTTARERYEFLKAKGIACLEEGDFEGALKQFVVAQPSACHNKFEESELDGYRALASVGLGRFFDAHSMLAELAQHLPDFDSNQRSQLGALLMAAVQEFHNAGKSSITEPFCVAVIDECAHNSDLYWSANFARARSMERQGMRGEAFNHLKSLHLSIEDMEQPEFLKTLDQAVQCSIRINEPGTGLRLLEQTKEKIIANYPSDSLPPLALGVLEAELYLASDNLARARQIAEQVKHDHGRFFRFLSPIEQIRNGRVLAFSVLQDDPHGALLRIEELQKIPLQKPDPDLRASLLYAQAYGHYLTGDPGRSLQVLDQLHAATYPLDSRERSIYYPHCLLLMSRVIGTMPDDRFSSPEVRQKKIQGFLKSALEEYDEFENEPGAVEGWAYVMHQLALCSEASERQSAAIPDLVEAIERLKKHQQEGSPLYAELVDAVRRLKTS